MTYVGEIDKKINEISDYVKFNVNCIICVEQLLEYFKNFKNSMINVDGVNITQELINLIEIIREKEKKWENLYIYSLNDNSNYLAKWPLYCFLFGAAFCLSCSSIFHLFCCHSEKTSSLLNRLDYSGISILIMGSCYPPYYYLFMCSQSNFLFKLISTFTFQ